jgi:ABC-type nitrate/sulfonate/bicarbonate transport system permease component
MAVQEDAGRARARAAEASLDHGPGPVAMDQPGPFDDTGRPTSLAGASRPAAKPVTRRALAGWRRPAHAAAPLLLTAVLIGTWQLYADHSGISPLVLPGPVRVVEQAWQNRSALWVNTVPTLEETLAGFGLSICVSWVLAVVCDFSAAARRAVEPLLVVSQTIPIIAIAPLFVIWFGFDMLPKVLVVAIVTFFPITVSLLQGFGTTPPELTSLLVSMGAGPVQRFLRVRVPTALPYFFSGLRISITYAVVGAIFGEYVGAQNGLGIYMQQSENAQRTDLVLAAVGMSAVVSLALYLAVTAIERLALPWAIPSRGGRR